MNKALGGPSVALHLPGPQEELSQYKVVVQSFGLPLANTLGAKNYLKRGFRV